MTRILYRALLLLHPSGFRRRFAGEMLCVFDEAAAESAASGFCWSIAWSLARHWLRHPGLWRTAGAIVGGGLSLLPRVAARHLRFPATAAITSDALILLTAGVLTAIAATLVVTVVLFQTLRRRRESSQEQRIQKPEVRRRNHALLASVFWLLASVF